MRSFGGAVCCLPSERGFSFYLRARKTRLEEEQISFFPPPGLWNGTKVENSSATHPAPLSLLLLFPPYAQNILTVLPPQPHFLLFPIFRNGGEIGQTEISGSERGMGVG